MCTAKWTQKTSIGAITLLLAASLALAGCAARADSGSSAAAAGANGAPATQVANVAVPAPPGGAGGSSTAQYRATGAYTLSSGTATKSGSISATADDESGVLVTKTGSLTLADANVTTSGNSKSADESSFYGLNAGVLAQSGGKIVMTGGTVRTTGSGANAVFAYGSGSAIRISGTTINATGQYAHGVMTSGGGSIAATNLKVNTTGGSSAPVATDRGGGTITVNGGTYTCSGNNSPGIYSTGKITADKATFLATGSEVVVIEGANTVTLNDSALTATKAGKWGVMIYQSMSGDAQGTKGAYTQTDGSLVDTAASSPLFYITNTTAAITLNRVKVTTASPTLVNAAAGQWGTSGANGGTVSLTADAQILAGNLVADKISSITATLKNGSTLKGAIDTAGTAKAANLTLDSSSKWTVTADSHLTTLTGAKISGATITNIVGGGHTVTYSKSASANKGLGGKTYELTGGGTLVAK